MKTNKAIIKRYKAKLMNLSKKKKMFRKNPKDQKDPKKNLKGQKDPKYIQNRY